MTLTIGWWIIPTILSIGFWLWTFLTPEEPSYGYIPDLMPFYRALVSLIVTLVSWLVYFIVF